MSKIRSITPPKIRKITGGKEPRRLVEEFMVRRGFDPEECLQQRTSQLIQWLVPVSEDEELEITLEGLNRLPEALLYVGINVTSVPIKNAQQVLVNALEVADTLIGAKLSLVNYDLVLSVTVYAASLGIEELDFYYELILRQKAGIRDAILSVE